MSRRLVVLAPNWLGDAVMALPAIADLRRSQPDSTIEIAARPAVAGLMPLVPGVDGSVVLGNRSSSIASLKAGRYDAALLLPNSFRSAWLAWSAGVPERWGYAHELRSPLLTKAVAAPAHVHQAEYYQRLTTALGFPPGPLQPRLEVPSSARDRAREALREQGWDAVSPLVAVAPGAAYGGAKRWPARSFADVVDGLAGDGVTVVLVGAAADRAAGVELSSLLGGGRPPIDLIGHTDLVMLPAVLAHCRALLTNDSGAMHVGAAVGIRVVAMFGPTNERETRPLGTGPSTVLHTDVWCRPCMLRECPLTHRCMKEITPDAVLHEARTAL